MTNKFKLWAIASFLVFYQVSSMFLSNTVLMQTFYNLYIFLITTMLLDTVLIHDKAHGWIKAVCAFYIIGQFVLIIFNCFLYWDKPIDVWFINFNNYRVLIPIYVISILASLGYLYGRGKYRKI